MNTAPNNQYQQQPAVQNRYLLICGLLEQMAHHDLYFVRIIDQLTRSVNRDIHDAATLLSVSNLLQGYRRQLFEIHLQLLAFAPASVEIPRRVPGACLPDSSESGAWITAGLEQLEHLEDYRLRLMQSLQSLRNHELNRNINQTEEINHESEQ